MDKKLIEYLTSHEIKYKIHKHPAVFTVAQSKELNAEIPGVFHTKNLFLKDEAGSFFLVCMDAHQRADLKSLKEKLQAKKKLYFASEAELKSLLNATPGSVSLFAMIHAPSSLTLVIDKKILESDSVGFHPNINTATLEISQSDLKKFLSTLSCKIMVFEI